ncbi:T-complex protein 11-domain-containing protein [Cercophora newfieldiana]|uniref:T-complex protein 11-domain-containing protein n=1 Tax=Cercophora newfieldiana TaxID=92897 RepID=A0AA39YG96_9PEZI|nr:T-complex protein 11-domain-containing protein [Cercophora newfieldiana]
MNEQGAGGGVESHLTTHRRQDSNEEPIPEPPVETRDPAPESGKKEKIFQALQELPRGSRSLGGDGSGSVTPVVEVAPGLSRNSSSCSTSSSSVRPITTEYLTAQLSEPTRRPSPLGRFTVSVTHRPLEPPVTKSTLSELDVHKIIHNPKLRHDINFDPELHFRPNLDGEKGRRKQEKANQFWTTLQEQLMQFVMDREGFLGNHGRDGDWCLPSLLRAVKEIITTLVPQRDRELLNEGLNVDLLMQQFNRGVADLEKLASWLSGVLKLHCAPMRDEWVDEMYNELSNGNRNNDMDELVKGMRSLLSVLEAMKLDVANHQIRCLRPVLIDDTVNFEQRFFMKKMQAGRLDVTKAKDWYREAQAYAAASHVTSPMPHSQAFGDTAVFFEALSRLVLPSNLTETLPPTFLFDEERIIKLRSDLYDSVCLEICMRKFDDLDVFSRTMGQLYSQPAYLREGSLGSNRSSAEFNFNTSRPSSLTFSDRGSAHSSPRNSGGLFANPIVDIAESRSRSQDLYNSLLALLQTAAPASRPAKRWEALAQPVALQILRYVNSPEALPEFEKRLAQWLTDTQGEIFREVELHFQQRLLGELAKRVKEFKNLSGVGLFSVATGGRVHGSSRSWDRSGEREHHRESGLFDSTASLRDPRDEAGIEDMATRLAHLGMLHWRVWGQPVYEGDGDLGQGFEPIH